METFTKLFGSLLAFVYHCFDRIVIQGYISLGISRCSRVRRTSFIFFGTCMASTPSPNRL